MRIAESVLRHLLCLVLYGGPVFAARVPSMNYGTPPIPPPVGPFINVSVTPERLSARASMGAGTYPVEQPLRLRVTSSQPGWYVQIHATKAKAREDEICPTAIYLLSNKESLPLAEPATVVQIGDVGETIIEAVIELRTTERHKAGTYVGELLVVAGYAKCPPSVVVKVPFEVEVACTLSHSIRNNKMYFHYGLPGKELRAKADGEVSAASRVCLSLSVREGRVGCLPMIKSVSSKNRREDSFIPLVWELRENGSGWREPDRISFDGGEISWELPADSEKLFYELQCSPRPDAAQAPGDYGTCATLTVVPIL